MVYYLWLGSHVPLLWHYLTARRLQHPLLYTIVIPVLFVFLIDMSISHTAMLAGYGDLMIVRSTKVRPFDTPLER